MKNDFPLSTDEIVSICLDRMVEGDWTLEECLARFPDHRAMLVEELSLVARLRELKSVQPRPEFRSIARQRLQRRLQNRAPRTALMNAPSQQAHVTQRRRPLAWAAVAIAAIVMVLLVAGGTTALLATADEAMPGDFLYELDLRLERRNLDSVNNLAEATDMGLRFSQERLKEARTLAEAGDSERAQVALTAHAQQLQEVAEDVSVAEPEMVDIAQIDDQVAAQSQELDAVYRQLAQISDAELSDDAYCDPAIDREHPASLIIADQYAVDPGTLTDLHCEGYEFGEIVLSLVTLSQVNATQLQGVENPIAVVLDFKANKGGWGLAWQAMGDIGRDSTPPGQEGNPAENAPGRPEDPGPPSDRGEAQDRQGRGQGRDQAPGQNQDPPGQGREEAPGQNQDPPGQPPGQGREEAPGQNQDPPGQGGPPSDPGNSNKDQNQPPGQSQDNDPPGQQDDPPKKPK